MPPEWPLIRVPVHDSDGDEDRRWVMVETDALDCLELDRQRLLAVARAVYRPADAASVRRAVDELPIDLLLFPDDVNAVVA